MNYPMNGFSQYVIAQSQPALERVDITHDDVRPQFALIDMIRHQEFNLSGNYFALLVVKHGPKMLNGAFLALAKRRIKRCHSARTKPIQPAQHHHGGKRRALGSAIFNSSEQ